MQANGKRKTFTSSIPGRRGKAEAERAADDWLESGQKENPRFDSIWDAFIAATKASSESSTTRQRDSHGRTWILPTLGKKKLLSITLQDMQDIIVDAANAGSSNKHYKNIRGTLTAFYGFARRSGYSMERPDLLTVPRFAPKGERVILQPDDLKILFSHDYRLRYKNPIVPHFLNAWRFEVLTGLRPGEVFGLQHGDFLGGSLVKLSRAVNYEGNITNGKNDNARRMVALTQLALQVIESQKHMLRDKGIISPWVFPGLDDKEASQRKSAKEWDSYKVSNGLSNVSPYELRHTLVSIASSYMPEKLVKQLVGHGSNMDTLGIYSHEIVGEAERTADVLSEVLTKILSS